MVFYLYASPLPLELTLDTLIEAINSLDLEEKEKLRSILNQQIQEIEDIDEIISAKEIATSDKAWNDYIAGNDTGISSQELNKKS